MAGKLKVQPMTRVGLDPLVALAEHLRATLPGWEDAPTSTARPYSPSDLALDLAHLSRHDGDSVLTASLGTEVVGFSVAYVRSRQLVCSQLWLLPDQPAAQAAEVLLRRTLTFGERAGAQDYSGLALGSAEHQALCFRFGFRPRFPIYRFLIAHEPARRLGQELSKLLPGHELTDELLARRTGSADLERIDRLTRGAIRPMDHEYWLTERHLRLATVRDGQRIVGYAYGGEGQCRPVAATTTEAALAGLGWALLFAAQSGTEKVELLVPAVFESAVEHLLEAGAQCRAAVQWMARQPAPGMERYVLASSTLV